MSRFKFRLDTVHRLREQAEKERARELATALNDAGSAEAERSALESMEQRTREHIEALNGEVGHQQAMSYLVNQVREQKTAAEQRCAEAAGVVRERQAEFVEAVTERKALDRLKERRFRDWKVDAQRRDQKAMDEVNSTRSARGSGRDSQNRDDDR